jgi:peptidoglycan/xylan/chitin deacetylase (PgdA/CDA1 family)
MESNLDGETNSRSCKNRKKRVNRIKTVIIIIVIILLILPTICCIVLGLQVSRLQKQMNELNGLHSQYGLNYSSTDGESFAFAAELEDDIQHYNEEHTVPGETDSITDSIEKTDSENSDMVKDGQDQSTLDQVLNKSNADTDEKIDGQAASDATASDKSTLKAGKYADKKVYLTFDDGPSTYTDDILDILAEYEVKATFFVVGKTDSQSKKLYQRIVDEGHTLGMHSYSHQYSKIYNSLEDFDKDFTKLWKLLYDTTGYKPTIFRFPGGSDNMVNKNGMEDFIRYLNEAKIVYFDWNVLNGDATGKQYTKEQLIKNVINDVAVKDNSIVLMHDSETKQTTVDSLPSLLERLITEDAQILPLDNNVPPIQMIQADTIK